MSLKPAVLAIEYCSLSCDAGASSWKKKTYPQLPLIQDFEKVREIKTLEDQSILTTLYTEKSVEFINKNKDKPFFCV